MNRKIGLGSEVDMKNPYYEDIRVITRIEMTDDNEISVYGCLSKFYYNNSDNIQKLYDNDSHLYTYAVKR